MQATQRLVIFDVDGTLVDSQRDILGAMQSAFAHIDCAPPSKDEILGIVGLSLPVAMARLVPDAGDAQLAALVERYKAAYVEMRAQVGAAESSPLYPGARDILDKLYAMPDVALGVATGKSKRGLDKLVEAHEMGDLFVTRQVADFHPSKPHPSMILQAMEEAGVTPDNTVMIGDTSFDMEMAKAAGVCGIGVTWGYHPVAALSDAVHVLGEFPALPGILSKVWSDWA